MSKSLAFYSADGFTQVTGVSLDDILAATSDTAKKYGVRNSGTEAWGSALIATIAQVGANDGFGQLRIAKDTATLSPPWGVSAAVSASGAGGTWGATGVYGAVITAYNGTGETVASFETTAEVTDTTQKITWSWTAVPSASGYKVYRTDDPGTYTSPALAATRVGNSTVTYIDDGSATSSGAPPSANTTGGAATAYGTPPSLSTGPVLLGALAIGQWVFIWIGRTVASGTTSDGNRRQAGIDFTD